MAVQRQLIEFRAVTLLLSCGVLYLVERLRGFETSTDCCVKRTDIITLKPSVRNKNRKTAENAVFWHMALYGLI
jgi:hypothetical protein